MTLPSSRYLLGRGRGSAEEARGAGEREGPRQRRRWGEGVDGLPEEEGGGKRGWVGWARMEDGPLALLSLKVVADDMDQGPNGQVTYMINQTLPMNGLYHIHAQTGTITTAAILDREIWAQTR